MIPLLPDTDALVTDALRASMPTSYVCVLWPDDWSEKLPLIVARRVSGTAPDFRGIDAAVIDVQCAATTRREASLIARTARVVLATACRDQFQGDDGYLTRFEEVTGPAELRVGAPDNGPDLFRFQATYRVTSRPTRP